MEWKLRDRITLTNDMREIYGFLRLANPFGHPSQERREGDRIDVR